MPQILLDQFDSLPQFNLNTFVRGNGVLEPLGQTLRFKNNPTTEDQYTNAQIDDYQKLSRHQFLWRPPLKMQVRARFSHPDGVLKGTAGFGFWNDPFMMTGVRRPTLPKAVWFFYASPPSNMKLDSHVPGFGWKAATIDVWHWPFFVLVPLAPLAVPLMNVPALYRLCWPVGQRAIRVQEQQIVASMTDWQTYELTWQKEEICFFVNKNLILSGRMVPNGPLGLVVWFDNQYMIVTPWGQFGYGLIETSQTQWMELDHLTITPV